VRRALALVLLLAIAVGAAIAQPAPPALHLAVNAPRTLTVRWAGDAAAWWLGTGPAVFYRAGPGPHAVTLGPDAYRPGAAVRLCAIAADASQACWGYVPALIYLPIITRP
jgi:hypothetical protein